MLNSTLHKVSKKDVPSDGESLIADTLDAYQPEMYSDKFFVERNQLITIAQQYIGDPSVGEETFHNLRVAMEQIVQVLFFTCST